jgi:hypothetical protein
VKYSIESFLSFISQGDNKKRLRNGAVFLSCKSDLTVFQGSLSSSQASQRYTEGRTADIVVSNDVAELDRAGITTMLTAYTNFQVGANFATVNHCTVHQSTNAIAV